MIKLLRRTAERVSDAVRSAYEPSITLSLDESHEITARDIAGGFLQNDQRATIAVDPNIARIKRNIPVDASTRKVSVSDVDPMTRRAAQLNELRGAVRGGRASVENQADIFFGTNVTEFIQLGSSPTDDYDVFDLSEQTIRRMKPSKVLEMLSDASPEMSRAFFDFLRMCCPGWELKGLNSNEEIDQPSQDYLNECVARLEQNTVASEVIFVKYFMSAFLRGALCSELVLDDRGREFVDIAMIDPESLEHHRVKDEQRGMIWKIYQRQGANIVDLNIPQVSYIPIDPFFKTNRGRALASPAVFVSFFLIATLQDLRRVIRNQGYPRMDIAVDIEKLKSMIPQAKANDMKALKDMAQDIVREVKTIYAKLKPDDAYIHSNVVTVNHPVGALNTSSLGVVDGMLKALERMATRALKTMPLMMATTDGVSEANANRQWEIHVAGIKSIQHYAESILESHFNLALRARGLRGKAEFRFSELRAAELFRDAQVDLINTTVARMQFDNGSINADEMAKKSAGKDKADQQEPRTAPAPPTLSGNPGINGNPEPGGNRWIENMIFQRMTAQDISEAKTLVESYAPPKLKKLLTAPLLNP